MKSEIDSLMNQIAEEMKKSRPDQKLLDRLNKKLDRQLGTELKEDDLDAAGAWERSRADGDDSL